MQGRKNGYRKCDDRAEVYNLGSIQRIPLGEGRTFHVASKTVAIFRARDGKVYATQPGCPHRGGPLADGLVVACKVICPLHSFVFDLATDEPVENACERLQTYPIRLSEAGIDS
ncbi:MAG TPA: Rieske 2Fe-2S domain-containing protein [Ktedonobacteraceae bacterium]